jgi:hypothetical protein
MLGHITLFGIAGPPPARRYGVHVNVGHSDNMKVRDPFLHLLDSH